MRALFAILALLALAGCPEHTATNLELRAGSGSAVDSSPQVATRGRRVHRPAPMRPARLSHPRAPRAK